MTLRSRLLGEVAIFVVVISISRDTACVQTFPHWILIQLLILDNTVPWICCALNATRMPACYILACVASDHLFCMRCVELSIFQKVVHSY